MRNLKKVLSLTLALVMMLGMMTFAGAAETTKITSKDLTDMKDVVNKEQVSLLVDLGIINGIKQADGTYKYAPKDSIERGAYAKMIYAVMMASNNADVYKGVNTGLKDVKGHWAEGFIGYCVSTKIAAGNGNGTFAPNANISVVAGAKMLLTALGYDAKASGYENDPLWSINIMRDAQAAGLLDDVAQAAGDTMTRDTAAQLIFNALFANTVTPKFAYDMGVKYLDEYRLGKTLGVNSFGLVKVSGTVTAIAAGGVATIPTLFVDGVNVSGGLSGTAITGVLPASPDMVGSEVTVYVKGVANTAASTLKVSAIYSSVLVKNAASVVATNYGYKDKGTAALTALLEDAATKVASYENGKTSGNVDVYYNGAVVTGAPRTTAVARIGEYGVVTEFKNNNGIAGVDTVVITEKKVSTVLAAPVMSKDSKGNDLVTFTTLGLAKVAADTVVGYEGLVKDDVILSVTIGGVTYIEKAASVEGIVSANHSTKGLLLNGTYYPTSALAGKSNTWSADFKNTYAFFLDNGKNIVKAVKITDKAAAASFAFLEDITYVSGTGLAGSSYLEAKLVFTDGTAEIVKVASVNDVKLVDSGSSVQKLIAATGSDVTFFDVQTTYGALVAPATAYVSQNTAADNFYAVTTGLTGTPAEAVYFAMDKTSAATLSASAKKLAPVKEFYEFSKNSDGEYLLKSANLAAGVTIGKLSSAAITKGNVLFDTATPGNDSTVFIFSTTADGKTTYKVYTGIANVPTTANPASATLTNVVVKNSSGIAMYVFVVSGAIQNASSDIVYISDASEATISSNGVTCYLNDAYLNGKAVEGGIKLNNAGYTVGLYTVASIDSNGIYTLAGNSGSPATPVTMGTGVKSIAHGTMTNGTFGGKSAYTYTADSKAFFIDKDNVMTATTVEALPLSAVNEFYLTVKTGTTTEIDTIYVVEKTATAPTGVVLAVTGASGSVTTIGNDDIDAGTATITAWGAAANKVKVSVAAVTGYTVKAITIGGIAYPDVATINNAPIGLTADGSLVITVAMADDYSGAVTVYSYTVAVSGKV